MPGSGCAVLMEVAGRSVDRLVAGGERHIVGGAVTPSGVTDRHLVWLVAVGDSGGQDDASDSGSSDEREAAGAGHGVGSSSMSPRSSVTAASSRCPMTSSVIGV